MAAPALDNIVILLNILIPVRETDLSYLVWYDFPFRDRVYVIGRALYMINGYVNLYCFSFFFKYCIVLYYSHG